MPESWTQALNAYQYSVDLTRYDNANNYPGFFVNMIHGDRESTIEFENYFRENVDRIEAWGEVVYWKLNSQPLYRNGKTTDCLTYWEENNISGTDLLSALNEYYTNGSLFHFKKYMAYWPFRTNRIVILATPLAFKDPNKFPMIDVQVSRWVLHNIEIANNHIEDQNSMLIEINRAEALDLSNWEFYSRWVKWTNKTSEFLSLETDFNWRSRDVEMAVFTAQRENLTLNPLR